MGHDASDEGSGARQPLLSSPSLSDDPNSPPLQPVRLSSLHGAQDCSVLVSGRIGRLQTTERIMAFTDAVLAIICTSCAVPLWANGTKEFTPVRLVPFVTTFLVLSRLWEKQYVPRCCCEGCWPLTPPMLTPLPWPPPPTLFPT